MGPFTPAYGGRSGSAPSFALLTAILLATLCCVRAPPVADAQSDELVRERTCGCAFEARSAGEVAVEILPADDSSRVGENGPVEQDRQTLSVLFAALDESDLEGCTISFWIDCHAVMLDGPASTQVCPFAIHKCLWYSTPCHDAMLAPCADAELSDAMRCALQADVPNAGVLNFLEGRKPLWRSGGDKCALLQVRGADGGVLAQGSSSFVAPATGPMNRTEGALSTLAAARPQACNAAERGARCGAVEDGFSSVVRHEWDLLACSQPRAPLRVLEVRGARWEDGRFSVWLAPAGMRAVRAFMESVGEGRDGEGVDGAGLEVGNPEP